MRALLVLLALLLWTAPARAEEIVLGLSSNRVAITATFDGDDILVFGAVKRDAPVPEGASPLGVIITVSGRPSARLVPAHATQWRSWGEIAELFSGPVDPAWEQDRQLLDDELRDPWGQR